MNPKKCIDETGHRYGRFTVLERFPVKNKSEAYWKCRCDCGVEVVVRGSNLRNGSSKSCGCLRAELNSKKMKAKWALLRGSVTE
jgi:hypothetical protein